MTVLDEEIKPQGNLVPLNSDIKPVGKLTPISDVSNKNPYYEALSAPDKLANFNKIINDIPELPGDSDSKKKLYKDLLLKGITPQESKDVLETLSGTHPHQEGGYKYYIDERGLPKPLKNNERPPQGFEVASIWGSKSDAEDDSPLTDLAKTVFNVLPSAAENVVDLAQTAYEGITDKPSEFLNSLKNSANYLKFEKDPDIQKSLLNTDGIDEFSDILDPKRWDLSPNAIWGTVNSLLGSVGEMYVGGSAAGRGISAVTKKALTNPQAIAATYTGSFLTNLGEARDAAERAGLEGRDKALFSSLVTAPIAAIDAKFDLGGKILMNKLMQEEKNAFIKKMALGVADRMADGELTQKALNDLAKATTLGYTQLAKKWGKETVSDILQQGGEEAAQSFMLRAGEQLWDKLTDEEKKKFGTDAFSPESFANYLQEGLAGMIGGAHTAFAFNKVKEQARIEAQNNTAYGIATKGPEAINSFKENVKNEVSMGKLSPQQAADAIFQVDAYAQYNEELKQGGVNLNDDQKKQVFNLTFQKQNLMSQVPTEYEKDKLGAIQQSQIDAKKKMADLIQKDIDKIVFRETVKNDPNATESAKEEIKKEEEKEREKKKASGIYVTPEYVTKEKRTYEEIPLEEWNDKEAIPMRTKKYKLVDYIDSLPEKTTYGTVNEDFRKDDIDTFNVTFGDGKSQRFASSMVRKKKENELGGFRGNTYEENLDDKEKPLGQKVGVTVKTLKDSGRKVAFIWNANKESPKYGKHIGMIKESLRGDSNYSTADLDEMADLRMTNMAPRDGGGMTEAVETPTPEGPITPADVKIVPPKIILGQPTRENLRRRFINEYIEKHKKDNSYLKEYEDKGIYEKIYGSKFDRLNPTLYAEKTTGAEQSVATTNEKVVREDVGGSKEKKVRTGKPRSQQKIKSKARLDALKLDVYDPKGVIMLHFIGGGKLSYNAVKSFYKGSDREARSRSHLVSKDGPTFDQLAHDLWEQNRDLTPNAEAEDYKNALEEVIQEYIGPVSMAEDLLLAYTEKQQQLPNEEIVHEMHKQAEKDGTLNEIDAIQDKVEEESDEVKSKLADDQQAFDKWEEDSDIKYFEGDVPFQKESAVKGNINKVVETIKKAMPKMTVIYNPDLKVAGYVYGDKIFINPDYAGIDTPIHEAGHVLIDAIGYDSPIIQQGIEQLKNTDLWNETKERYPELNEEMLGKEVLAEAIGREGANIFDSESKKNKFIQWLNYFFALVKQKLGIDKNVAKSLAKQIIGGIGTKEMTGSKTVQKQKVKEKVSELEGKSEDELIKLYNQLIEDGEERSKLFTAVKIQLAYQLFTKRKEEIQNSAAAKKFIEKIANRTDISKKDILFKTLSHMSERVPELQKFSNMFEEAHFNAVKEANSLNKELERLGKAVIKEKNASLGITDKIKGLFMSDNAKYFDYLENPQAKKEFDEETGETSYVPGYWTEEQAKEKGFSKAQIDFLNFMRKLQQLRNEQYEQSGNTGAIDDILKVDKGVLEAYKDQGLMEAFSAYLGNSYALKSAEVKFKDPKTGEEDVIPYGEVEQKLVEYGKQGVLEKLNALQLLLRYNFKARRASTDKGGRYNLSPSGKLNNKFLKPRDKSRGYSKDFYKAAHDFIQDYSHTKHMSPLLPYIDAIETLNARGFEEHAKKENVVKWIKEWKDAKLFKNEKFGKLGPEVDAGLRMLRSLTSQLVMGFNLGAAGFNLLTGLYNNWRAETSKEVGIGLKRFANPKNKNKLKGIIDNYQVVATEYDSDPQKTAGKLFEKAAYGITRAAEYIIQGSMFAGLMTEQDWNSFDENGNVKESLTPKEKKELEARIIKYKNRVSDIQGKYSEKDRRNFMNTEFGKAASQFKVWVPDWIKERFGAGYIDANNEYKVGSYKQFWDDGFNQIRGQIKDGSIWKDKNAMSNLKAALTVATLLSLKLSGDDDEKKRRSGDMLSQMLNNVLFIFDPHSLKFTMERPMASIGTLTKFVDVLQYAITLDEYKKDTRFGNKGDLKIWEGLAKLTPYSKIIINDFVLPKE